MVESGPTTSGVRLRVFAIVIDTNALGRRIQRSTSNGEVQKFVYDGEDVIEDLDADENVVTRYLNGPGIDNKIRQTDANGNLYYVSDHLGSTIALTDDSGEWSRGLATTLSATALAVR